MSNSKYFVKANGSKAEVKQIYESYSGWYWYITEYDKQDPNYAFGLVKGLETEWGSIWIEELKNLKGKVWEVPRKDWIGVPLLQHE